MTANKEYRILTINLGSTSSSASVFDGSREIVKIDVAHSVKELQQYSDISAQAQFRKEFILSALSEHHIAMESLDAIASRGIGKMGRYHAGAYRINAHLAEDAKKAPHQGLAAGTLIAYDLSELYHIPAYLYDVVRTDEISDMARISGTPAIERSGATHTLNTRAVARQVAQEQGASYEEVTYILSHLGGGIGTSLHCRGSIVDVVSMDEGTFSADRAGRVPCEKLLSLVRSGKYDADEMAKMLRGKAGLIGYLGTNDCVEIEKRIEVGDKKAECVYRAMAYQVAKDIGSLAAAACGRIDAIILTGGIAYSGMFTSWLRDYVSFIAPIICKPGSMEMQALQRGIARVLSGDEPAREYIVGQTVV